MWSCFQVLLVLLLVAVALPGAHGLDGDLHETGHSSCPCVALDEIPPLDPSDLVSPTLNTTVGYELATSGTNNLQPYGYQCHPHDASTPQCQTSTCQQQKDVIPAPTIPCDDRWCRRNWCYIDPAHCDLAYRHHSTFQHSHRYLSYATCGEMDSHTRLAALEGQVIKIGLNANTGGWLGSYSSDQSHFTGPITKWSGLAVDFVLQAATRGKFFLNVTQPPNFLRERAQEFFQSTSQFDLCVYATSLGYLDMCVAQYTITDQRATSTDWLVLGSSPLYLLVDWQDDRANQSSWSKFWISVATIFQPFTPATWAFIVFFVIPVLGCLMVAHERGKGGSTYPTSEAVVVTDESKGGDAVLQKRPVPLRHHLIKSIYIAFLAVLQQSYEQSVLTHGAMLHLLGISFFILTIIAVYTANLAAILTQSVQETTVDSFDKAVRAGYRFCSERKNMETLLNLYPHLDASTLFVADPLELGGDGLPGFNCHQCQSRQRVFTMLDPVKATQGDLQYCHAAIAPSEDLEVFHAAAKHCAIRRVGSPVQTIQTGIPIFEPKSPALISYFLKLQNDGHFDAIRLAQKPESQCPVQPVGEGHALTLEQLSGIWVVSFGFALVGLLVKCIQSGYKRRYNNSQFQVRKVHKRDQRGGKVDALGIEDSWMTAGTKTITNASESTNRNPDFATSERPIMVHGGSRIQLMHPDEQAATTSSQSRGFLPELTRRRPLRCSDNMEEDQDNSTQSRPAPSYLPQMLQRDRPPREPQDRWGRVLSHFHFRSSSSSPPAFPISSPSHQVERITPRTETTFGDNPVSTTAQDSRFDGESQVVDDTMLVTLDSDDDSKYTTTGTTAIVPVTTMESHSEAQGKLLRLIDEQVRQASQEPTV